MQVQYTKDLVAIHLSKEILNVLQVISNYTLKKGRCIKLPIERRLLRLN